VSMTWRAISARLYVVAPERNPRLTRERGFKMRVNDVAGNMLWARGGGVQQRGTRAAQPGHDPRGALPHGRPLQLDPRVTPL